MNDNTIFALLSANVVDPSTFAAPYVSYLMSKATKLQQDVEDAITSGGDKMLQIGTNLFVKASDLKDVMGQDITPESIRTYAVDKVANVSTWVESVGSVDAITQNINGVICNGKLTACALAALGHGATEEAADVGAYFANLARTVMPNVESKMTDWYSYCLQVVSSKGYGFTDKLASIMSKLTTKANDSGTGLLNDADDITGANPALCFINNGGWTAVANVVANAVADIAAVVGGVFGFAVSAVIKAVQWGWNFISNSLADPIDVKNVIGGKDCSFTNGYWTYTKTYTTDDAFLTNAICSELMSHYNQLMCISTLGGTIYARASDGLGDPAYSWVDITIYIKFHMYASPNPAVDTGFFNNFTSYTTLMNWISSTAGGFKKIDITENSNEHQLMRNFFFSKECFLAGLSLISPSGETYMKEAYIDGDYSHWSGLSPIIEYDTSVIASSHTITNVEWMHEVQMISNTGMSASAAAGALFDCVISRLDEMFTAINQGSWFFPYKWTNSQLAGSYAIKTDAENGQAYGTAVIAIVGVVVAIAATIGYSIVQRKLRKKAFESQRQADNIAFDDNATPKQAWQAQRKANIWASLSGSADDAGSSAGSLLGSTVSNFYDTQKAADDSIQSTVDTSSDNLNALSTNTANSFTDASTTSGMIVYDLSKLLDLMKRNK